MDTFFLSDHRHQGVGPSSSAAPACEGPEREELPQGPVPARDTQHPGRHVSHAGVSGLQVARVLHDAALTLPDGQGSRGEQTQSSKFPSSYFLFVILLLVSSLFVHLQQCKQRERGEDLIPAEEVVCIHCFVKLPTDAS
ncbi:hypothetical protein CDAR_198781 [Caerostris darwini]|uniref:Uncharacterized protein n=1 Tax=Caerostris darwini TaxID=1538125 RepID=A0AAV4W5Q0_9ARAC|nr:hypothetical protein CDAR_198781 [Caerostris darwini]